ncbi:VWA domain-containing protein [Micromonospora mirobrigensis]|uniref:von Willebrand factor type A domain-containing protein n=1 Tax=Micromonospora mirobrigensis TaxID=262898 RepID=A0A1C4YAQ4_9ACTN|nr:VWA domain-containing protein [Micromonospora mirobrigensis]SCF17750.1 von Willebrand factor type A domain-containing protein [Micromonospora mirobrigensis]
MSILSTTRARGRWSAVAALALVAGLLPLVAPQAATPAHAASPTTATLTVNKGGDRLSEDVVGPLAGAVFDFYAGVSGTRPGLGDTPTASCTTGADGRCSVDVPGLTGTNQGYWIIERSAPAGWRLLQTLDTGGGTTTPTVYNGVFTGAVSNNVSYEFPVNTTGNTNRTARGAIWADARANPPLPADCGLSIALLIDVSGSIAPNLPDVKNAANGFVDALTGTPSEIGLYTFATNAATVLNPVPVSDTSGANTVKNAINGLTAGGNTNWDAGLFQVAAAPNTYDAVIVLTDGNPTVYGPPPVQGPGNFTRFKEVENGVFSANAVKAEGTRVVAVGVGAGVSGSANNLSAISGPVAGSDYIQTGYEELAAVFRQLALEACAGTISVVKKVIPAGGTPADAVPSGGWTISTSTPGVTPGSAVTDTLTGAVNFDVDLTGVTSKPVTLAETPQAGFTLEQQAGDNAACTANGSPAPVTNSGPNGFTVDAQATAIVSCVILNREAEQQRSTIVVHKTWVINGVPFENPDQPVEFQSDLSISGINDPAWNTPYDSFATGTTVTIGETIDQGLLPTNCGTVAVTGDTGPVVLALPGLNTFRVTNTVTCPTRLTLAKQLQNPYGTPEPSLDAWTLRAILGGSAVVEGTNGVTGDVDPNTFVSLAETTVPGFTQFVTAGAVITPPATGSWDCGLRESDGSVGPTYTGALGLASVPLGETAVCTATNVAQAATLTLVKEVSGGTAQPQDWILEAAPLARNDVPVPVVISGRSGTPAVTGAEAFPNVTYGLSERDGPADYEQVGTPQCVLTGTSTVVPTPNNRLTPTFGQDITCTFRNQAVPPPAEARVTLVKQVENGFGGTATPQDWTLSATPPVGSGAATITGRSGEPAVTNAVARAGLGYALTESGGPAGYAPIGDVRCVYNDTGDVVPTPDNVLTPVADRSYTCTWRNGQLDPGRPHLTLVKKVEEGKDGWTGPTGGPGWTGPTGGNGPTGGPNGSGGKDGWGGKADPTDWLLTATPLNGADPISGRSGSPSVTGVTVEAGVGYRLSESQGPKGYELVDLSCVLTGTDESVPVVDDVVTPELRQDITCTFTNRAVAKPYPPHKGGWKHLPVTGMKLTGFVAGGSLAVLAGVVLLIVARRRRSMA